MSQKQQKNSFENLQFPAHKVTFTTVYCLLTTAHSPLPAANCYCYLSYSPLPTAHRCQLPTAYCPLPTAHCQLPTAYCLLPTAYCLPPTAHCPLPTAHCLPPTAYCLPPTACRLLPTAHCLLPTASLPHRPGQSVGAANSDMSANREGFQVDNGNVVVARTANERTRSVIVHQYARCALAGI